MSEEIEEIREEQNVYTGTCRFCGQKAMVKGPFGRTPTQKEIDAIATDRCDCDEAIAYRLLEQKCRMLQDRIEDLHMKNAWIHDVLTEAIQPIASNDLTKVQITDGSGTTYTLTCGKQGPKMTVRGAMATIVTAGGVESIAPEDWRDEE